LARRIEEEVKNAKKAHRASAGDLDSFTNRYDPEANRCYVEQFTFHYHLSYAPPRLAA
jgi:endo-1,4-beta-mannosidase